VTYVIRGQSKRERVRILKSQILILDNIFSDMKYKEKKKYWEDIDQIIDIHGYDMSSERKKFNQRKNFFYILSSQFHLLITFNIFNSA
jgi:hypothetical protein